jgi:hypothetical protein
VFDFKDRHARACPAHPRVALGVIFLSRHSRESGNPGLINSPWAECEARSSGGARHTARSKLSDDVLARDAFRLRDGAQNRIERTDPQ